jgi:ADP-L-glycero-D-manno-heptose 6-epimerase
MIVVTGALGFIGSVIVKMLNDMGVSDILIVDRFRDSGKWLNVRGLKFKDQMTPEQFMKVADYQAGSGKYKAIYHMGACSATTEQNMDFLYENNVRFSRQLFDICSQYNIPICYASSAATYGDGENGYDDDHQKVSSLRPLNPYGYSKQLFDQWVLEKDHFPQYWYGVKFFNVYGPNEYHKGRMSSVVYQSYNQIRQNGVVKLFKSYKDGYQDGQQLRDFVYVKDVVRAMLQLIAQKAPCGIYNLGSGKARSFYDLVDATYKAMGEKTNIEFIEMPNDLRQQYQYYTQAKMDKLARALPDFKFHTLEDGVKDYVQNHLMQKSQHLES